MKNRLVKAFNEIYFRDVKGKGKALSKDCGGTEINKKSVECTQNKEALALLSDLLKLESTGSVTPYSETASNILWELSEAKVNFRRMYPEFPEEVKVLLGHLNFLSDNACFVGGCVRDILIGKTPKDFDFVCDVKYDVLKRYLEQNGYKVQEKGEQFLVLIASKNGEQFEIANYRKDAYKKLPKYVRRIK